MENDQDAQLATLRAANDALTKAADELRSELAKNVLQEDSYGVPESSFYICPYCHHESGAGVLNKGITHAEDCILSGNYEIAMARIGTLAETQEKLVTAEAEIDEMKAMLETDRVHAAAVQSQLRAQLDRSEARIKELESQLSAAVADRSSALMRIKELTPTKWPTHTKPTEPTFLPVLGPATGGANTERKQP